ncbi:MAG TPA: hypothetical protein VEK33_12490 [Terriglobales bacterium]|nr:hypothetical protein [Terriglobales bacterium]
MKLIRFTVSLFAVSLFALLMPMAFGANVHALKGTYAFSVTGISVDSQDQSDCDGCAASVVTKVKWNAGYGEISFDGAGHATFTKFVSLSGAGGPAGHTYGYSVSGNVANIANVLGSPVAIQLGAYNSSGVATVLLFLVTNTGQSSSPLLGVGTLQ